MKFGRIFSMLVQGKTADHTIQSPLTCRFKVNSNSLFSCGTSVFQIYNLASDVRADIYKDAYSQLIYKRITFAAGYEREPSVPIIFQGNVLQAYSYRQGPDWITEISALDGGFAVDNGSINLTKPSPYNFEDVLADAVRAMPNVKLGVIGTFDLDNSRGITFGGNPWDLIAAKISPMNGQAFINKETVNIIRQWEFIEDAGVLDTISVETGMLGTPRLQEAIVKVQMIFEPRLEIAQAVELETLESRMNGDYKILSLTHSGTISGAVCDSLETEAVLFQPDRELEAA